MSLKGKRGSVKAPYTYGTGSATIPRATLEEFARLSADGARHELNAGELVTLPPPKSLHSRVARTVFLLLESFLRQTVLDALTGFEAFAEAGFVLSWEPLTLRQPDVSLLSKEKVRATDADSYFIGAPDLAVAGISPTDLAQDVAVKVRQYLATGSQQVWVLYPRHQELHVFRPDDSVTILDRNQVMEGGRLLTGFAVKVGDFFAI